MAVDEDLADVVLAGGDGVDAQQELAEPAPLGTGWQLRRGEEGEEQQEADREADAVRAREDAHDDPERAEEDGQERSDEEARQHRVADDRDPPPEEPDVWNGDGERRQPE